MQDTERQLGIEVLPAVPSSWPGEAAVEPPVAAEAGAAPRPLFVRLNEWMLGGILAVMAVLQFTNVIVRYFTDDSVAWAEEVSRHLMIWLVFLGLGSAFRIGLHMAIDNLHRVVPPAFARTIRLGIIALLAGTCAVLVYQGWVYVGRTGMQTTPVTQIPFSYVYAALPVGFALMLFHVLAIGRCYVRTGAFDISEDVAPSDANAL